MTIASKGSLGTALNTGNNQTSTTHTTSVTNVAIGDLVVLIVAVDNGSASDGDQGAVVSVTDPGGNAWEKAVEFTNSQAAAQGGACVSIWWTRATAAINTGTVITIDFLDAQAASFDESCSTGWVFTCNAPIRVVATATQAGDAQTDIAASLDAATSNTECLRVRGISSELNLATQMTVTASPAFSLFTNTLSAAVATAIGVRGEFIISTGTGAASNPTLVVTSSDHAHGYAAFTEAKIGEARFAGAGSFSVDATQVSAETPPILREASQAHLVPYSRTILYPSVQRPTPFREAVAHQGEARFAGAGNFSALASLREVISARFNGAGDFSALASLRGVVSARFAGTGSLSVEVTVPGAAVFEPASVTHVVPYDRIILYPSVQAPVPIVVAGVQHVGEARFNGVGNLSAHATLNEAARATFQGAGSLSVDARKGIFAAAIFNGTGSLSALVTMRGRIEARFAGVGSLSVDALRAGVHVGEATFAGVGNLSAHVTGRLAAQATLQGAGNLSAYARQIQLIYARFAGAGSLSVQALQAGFALAEAKFDGSGNLSAHATGRLAAQATFQGAGNLSVHARQAQVVFATFGGTGSLSVDAAKVKPLLQATFQGTGSLSANVTATLPAFARFAGSGSFAASVQQRHVVQAIFAGSGNFSAHAAIVTAAQVAEATFAGAGNLSARIARQGQAAYAIFAGAGTLSAYARQDHRSQAIFGGAGSLRVETTVRSPVVIEARFAGSGSLSAHLRQALRAQARFAGAGTLSAHAGKSHFIEAIFGGRGDLSPNVIRVPSGTQFAEAIFNGEGTLSVATIIRAQRRTTSRRGELTVQSARDNTPNDVRPDPAINRRPTYNPRRTQR